MKKIFCCALIALMAYNSAFSQTVSEAEAQSIGVRFLQKRASEARAATLGMETVSTARLKSGAPAYFVMQPADGQGFVVLSASRAAEPILGYSTTDSFDPQHLPPALRYLLDSYRAQLEIISVEHLKPTAKVAAAWNRLASADAAAASMSAPVGPLLHTRWNQFPLYNKKCPAGAPTGCVATTMAQLMRYWRYPVTNQTVLVKDEDDDDDNGIAGTFESYLGGGYNWTNMPDSLNMLNPVSEIDEIAKLMYDCGVAAEMNYGTDASESNIGNAAAALSHYFGYEEPTIFLRGFYSDDWSALLKANINAGYPMYYRGDGDDGGHAWVCDGYQDDHFHMNWGWGESSEQVKHSYWTLDDLSPRTYHFNDEQAMFAPKPQGCIPFASLSGVQVNPTVEVAYWISASSTLLVLPGPIPFVFNAHDEIVLTNGFTAGQGTDFHAFIQGCDGNFADPYLEDRAQPATEQVEVAGTGEVTVAPNPFSGSTTITYTLSSEQPVAMQLLDAMGKLIATPMIARQQGAGEHQFNLEAGSLPAGLYFLVLQMGEKRQTKRLVLTN